MLEFLRRLTIRQCGLLIFLLVSGISMFVIGVLNLPYIITGKTDNVNEIIARGDEPEKLSIVDADIQYVLGCYAKSETTRRGATLSEKYHYIVMFEDGTCMSLAVKDKATISYLSRLMNETESYLLGYTVNFSEPLHITATVKGISGEGKDLYYDGLNVIGVPSDYVLELELQKGELRGILAVIMIAGIAAVIFAIIYFRNATKEKKEKARRFAELDEMNNDPLKAFSKSSGDDSEYNYEKINYGRETENMKEQEEDDVPSQPSTTSKFTLKKD